VPAQLNAAGEGPFGSATKLISWRRRRSNGPGGRLLRFRVTQASNGGAVDFTQPASGTISAPPPQPLAEDEGKRHRADAGTGP